MAPVLHLSQQSNTLRKFHRGLLPRIKVNRNFLLALMPIALSFEGLGFKTLELEQGLESISRLISIWVSGTHVSNLFRISLAFLQLEVGSADIDLNKSFSL